MIIDGLKERPRDIPLNARRLIPLLALLALTVSGCGTAQIGPDDESFRAVDALYTAVSLRDAAQVGRCEATLRRLRDAGKLPSAAADSLTAVVAEAKGERWEPARERLRDFMLAQRP